MSHLKEVEDRLAALPTGKQFYEKCRKTKNSLDKKQEELRLIYFASEKDEDDYGGVGGAMNEGCQLERAYYANAYFDFCKARGVEPQKYPWY